MPLLLVGLASLGAGFFGGVSTSDKFGSALKMGAVIFGIILAVEFLRRRAT